MRRRRSALDFFDMAGAFVAVAMVMGLLVAALFHCVMQEERLAADYDVVADDMRAEARYRAGQWLRESER